MPSVRPTQQHSLVATLKSVILVTHGVNVLLHCPCGRRHIAIVSHEIGSPVTDSPSLRRIRVIGVMFLIPEEMTRHDDVYYRKQLLKCDRDGL